MGEGRLKADSRSALQPATTMAAAPLDDGQEQSFDGELPDDARAARAERRAHADLALAIGRARQEQRRDVEARDEEHHADHGECHPRDMARGRGLPGCPSTIGAKTSERCRVVSRMRGGQPGRDALQIRRPPALPSPLAPDVRRRSTTARRVRGAALACSALAAGRVESRDPARTSRPAPGSHPAARRRSKRSAR